MLTLNSSLTKRIVMTDYNLLNFNESAARVTVMKILNENERATFIVDEKLEKIVEDIADELDMEKNVMKDGNTIKITVYPSRKEEVSKSTLIDVDVEPKIAFNIIRDPTLLMAIIPQIKSVSKLGEDTYSLRIKWVISWDTPLSVQALSLKETSFTVKFSASQKLPLLKVSFGFDFLIFEVTQGKSMIKIKEWYTGPFSSLAKGEMEKHLKNAEKELPSIIAQQRT
ncbi:hypothetical protein [Sulfuracidifex metallicus]|nr:hypothetical protein [Sulfuracidifex metallicus]